MADALEIYVSDPSEWRWYRKLVKLHFLELLITPTVNFLLCACLSEFIQTDWINFFPMLLLLAPWFKLHWQDQRITDIIKLSCIYGLVRIGSVILIMLTFDIHNEWISLPPFFLGFGLLWLNVLHLRRAVQKIVNYAEFA